MAVKDIVVTVLGATASLAYVAVVPQADGSILLEAVGKAQDSNGKDVTLATYSVKIQPGSLPAVDSLLVAGLSRLRQLNGLE